jgi:thioredoxin 1
MLTSLRAGMFAAPLLVFLSTLAQAGQPFDARSFQEAQSVGKTILVDVSATWCPTCKAQKPIVQGIERKNPQLVVYDVDFDTAKDVLKRFRVQYQSTLIVFKGEKEIARSTGDTDPGSIQKLVARGL